MHSGKDGAFTNEEVYDDYYYQTAESVTIFHDTSKSSTYDIFVEHYFNYYEAGDADADHMIAGKLTVAINGKMMDETWSHDVDKDTPTHLISGEENPDYINILQLEMACTEECSCSIEEKTE